MASFISGAINRALFSSVTSNVLGFDSAVTLSTGVSPFAFTFNGVPFTFGGVVFTYGASS